MSNFSLHELQIERLHGVSDRRYRVQMVLSHVKIDDAGRVCDDFRTSIETRLDSLPATTDEEWVNWFLGFLAEKIQENG